MSKFLKAQSCGEKAPLLPVGGMMKLALVALVAAGVAGCQQQRLITGSTLHDGYRTTHPIKVDKLPKVLDIPVGTRATHLSTELTGVVRQFAQEARSEGVNRMYVMVPVGTRNEAAAHAVAYSAQSAITSAGYPYEAVSMRQYSIGMPEAIAPVRLVYYTVGAKVDECGLWQSDVGDDSHPNGYSEYGCATQANLAAMVSNSGDFLYPQPLTPPDAARRVQIFKKYQAGESTATEYETETQSTTGN